MSQTSAASPQLDHAIYDHDATANRAPALASLNSAFADLSSRACARSGNVTAARREMNSLDLDERTGIKAHTATTALLEELAVERGLAWSDIARLCSVSMTAIRKWRSGESPMPDRRLSLAGLVAFLDLLDQAGSVDDPASWLFMRLSDDHTATVADLYIAGKVEDLLEHAQGFLTRHDTLDRWDPEWRTATRSDWTVTTNADGHRVLTRRG